MPTCPALSISRRAFLMACLVCLLFSFFQFSILNSQFSIQRPCYRLDLLPNDPFYTDKANVETDFQKWIYDGIEDDRNLNAETAWGLSTGRPDVVIAVIDSGVQLSHPDLQGNLWTNDREIPGNGLDDDGNGYVDDVNGWDFINQKPDPNPDLGTLQDADANTAHGTFIAGLIAARGNNRIGIAGTTWQCRIMPLKVFPANGEAREPDLAAAVRYAASNGANVINLSFSSPVVGQELRDAIAFAQSRNVVVVASAGDTNSATPRFPARLPGVISVGASGSGFQGAPRGFNGDAIGGRAPFSTYGPAALDVVAPGYALSTSVLSRFDEHAGEGKAGTPVYAFRAGTSVSSALVSGLAALIISRARDRGTSLTAEQVRNIILSTTVALSDDPEDRPDGGNTWAGRGRVEFVNALNAVGSVGAAPLVRSVVYDAPTQRLVVRGDNFADGKAVVSLNGVQQPLANHRYKQVSSGLARKITVSHVAENLLPAGVRVQVTVTNLNDGQVSAPFTFVR